MAPINTGKEGNPMKKNLRVPVLAAALAGAMVLGAGATTVAERVSADLRPDITVTVDGKDQTLLTRMAMLSTRSPMRAPPISPSGRWAT